MKDDYNARVLAAVVKAAAGVQDCLDKIEQCWNPGEGCPRNSPRTNDNWADSRSGTWSTAGYIYTLCAIGEGRCSHVRQWIRWLILSCQNTNGSFPHFHDDHNKENEEYVLPTSYFVLALQECRKRQLYPFDGTEDEASGKAIDALVGAVKWLLDAARLDGQGRTRTCSWGLKRAGLSNGHPYTVSTALVVQALASVQVCSDSMNNLAQPERQKLPRIIKVAIRWIQQRKCMSGSEGGWSSTEGDTKPQDYPTAMALQALQACGVRITDKELSKAVCFLKNRQRPDGGWASYIDTPCEVLYYSAPAIAYTIFTNDRETMWDEKKIGALLWLITLAEDGMVHLEGSPRVTMWPTREWILYVSKMCTAIGGRSLREIASAYAEAKDRIQVTQRSLDSLKRQISSEVNRRIAEKEKSFRRWQHTAFILGGWFACVFIASLIVIKIETLPEYVIALMYTIPLGIAGLIARLWR